MSLRTTVLRSLLVAVAGSFTAAGKVTGVAPGTGSESADEDRRGESTVTPPGPVGPAASAGRQAVMTGVGPGPESESDD